MIFEIKFWNESTARADSKNDLKKVPKIDSFLRIKKITSSVDKVLVVLIVLIVLIAGQEMGDTS